MSGPINYSTSTISGGGYTLSLGADQGRSKPATEPKGLIATQAVNTARGWLGQVYVDKIIVFETEPQEESETAINLANERVVGAVSALFAGEQ